MYDKATRVVVHDLEIAVLLFRDPSSLLLSEKSL